MKIILIRHSKTKGNLEGRYIGSTDESLCKEGIEILNKKKYPEVELVFSSPMKRCKETAEIIYGDSSPIIINELKECHFGDFENKNYEELNGTDKYQKFIDTCGKSGIPNAENHDDFIKRSVKGFDKAVQIMKQKNISTGALIIHGGTIMSILHNYSFPHKDFYNWQVKNGEGYIIQVSENNYIKIIKKIV